MTEMDSMEEMEMDGDDDNGQAHQKLISSLLALDGKKTQRERVKIRSSNVSSNLDLAVHASRDRLKKLKTGDLKSKNKHESLKLEKPLNTLETEKAKRKLVREKVNTEMTQWEPVVKEIRSASQTVYSNRPHGLEMFQAMQPRTFTPRTPLEKELYTALGKDECIVQPDQILTAAEKKALKAMSVTEAKARRAELMKHHELLSRMERKAKHQKKIKSKRYRKMLQRDKITTEKKALETLRSTDPDAFMEKMELIEKNRMEERLTLKHKGGGKFSRLHKAYSKFDEKSREAIQAMLEKSKELTKKREVISEDEEEEEAKEKMDEIKKDSDIDKMIEAILKGKVQQKVSVELIPKEHECVDSINMEYVKTKKEEPESVIITIPSSKTKKEELENVIITNQSSESKEMTMEELFADEDVVEEFIKETKEVENRNTLKLNSNKLLGWGSWAGPDYKHQPELKRHKKRLKDNKKKRAPLKQPYVWINPDCDQAIKKLLPKKIPFPYTSVEQFDMSLRQPVSRGLVPETVSRLLTKPNVVTKLGHIIKPLDKEEFLNPQEKTEFKSTEFRKFDLIQSKRRKLS